MARKKRRKRRIASRGSINAIILRSLLESDKYGYEIIKDLHDLSHGKIVIKQPSLYSSLNRFEDRRMVSSYWGDSDIGGRRHYYHLTALGSAYYRKVVLKESDEVVEQNLTDEEKTLLKTITAEKDMVDGSAFDDEDEDGFENDSNDSVESGSDIEDEQDSEELEDSDEENTDEEEIEDEPNIKDTHGSSPWVTGSVAENVIRYNYVPTEDSYSRFNSVSNENTTENDTAQVVETSPQEDDNLSAEQTDESSTTPWKNLSNEAMVANKKVSRTNYKVMYFKKPKSVSKVIKDTDGIYKLRDENYVPTNETRKDVIIDNVGKRRTPANIYGYTSYTDTPVSNSATNETTAKYDYSQISEEEKKRRNEEFLDKFNMLSMSKMKPVTPPPPEPEPEKPKEEEKPIDYIGKLGAIVDKNNEDDEPIAEENNLFNYSKTDTWGREETVQEDEDDKFIDFTPAKDNVYETQPASTPSPKATVTSAEDREYIEKISSFAPSTNNVKIITYENKSNEYLDKSFILINKLRLVFGIIMTLVMVLELTIALVSLKLTGLIQTGADKTVIIVAFCLVGVFALITILPYCFNKNEHKAVNFKLKYSIWFGLLTFLVSLILIYCANALGGFALDNFKFFAVRLIVPAVLTINFVIGPLVYWSLFKKRSFYD